MFDSNLVCLGRSSKADQDWLDHTLPTLSKLLCCDVHEVGPIQKETNRLLGSGPGQCICQFSTPWVLQNLPVIQ